jgi:hypothetical protein
MIFETSASQASDAIGNKAIAADKPVTSLHSTDLLRAFAAVVHAGATTSVTVIVCWHIAVSPLASPSVHVRVTTKGQAEVDTSWYVTVVMAQLSVATPRLAALLNIAYVELIEDAENTGPVMEIVEQPVKLRVIGHVVITGAVLAATVTVLERETAQLLASVIVTE